jgi:hypothetical protein
MYNIDIMWKDWLLLHQNDLSRNNLFLMKSSISYWYITKFIYGKIRESEMEKIYLYIKNWIYMRNRGIIKFKGKKRRIITKSNETMKVFIKGDNVEKGFFFIFQVDLSQLNWLGTWLLFQVNLQAEFYNYGF